MQDLDFMEIAQRYCIPLIVDDSFSHSFDDPYVSFNFLQDNLLRLAGIAFKPTESSIDTAAPGDIIKFIIKGLSKDEIKRFKTYLGDTTDNQEEFIITEQNANRIFPELMAEINRQGQQEPQLLLPYISTGLLFSTLIAMAGEVGHFADEKNKHESDFENQLFIDLLETTRNEKICVSKIIDVWTLFNKHFTQLMDSAKQANNPIDDKITKSMAEVMRLHTLLQLKINAIMQQLCFQSGQYDKNTNYFGSANPQASQPKPSFGNVFSP